MLKHKPNQMFKTIVLSMLAAVIPSMSMADAQITGAGSTFAYPIMAKWADAYKKETNVSVNYQSIGSSGGVKQVIAKTVDFGASDAPMSGADLEKNGLIQFPFIIGGIVPVLNLKEVKPGELKLTGELVANIYLGKIKKWNDPAITALNPSAKLPDLDITVVHRSDGSGTTFTFSNYLSKVSPDWKAAVGEGNSLKWPTGLGGKGNEGVAQYVSKVVGAIGYTEYSYAKQNKLDFVQMKNKEGEFVLPDDLTFKEASAKADWKGTPGGGVILTDQAGKKTWPITTATFALMQKTQDKPENAKEVLKFFEWAFKNGGKTAEELDYVHLPTAVQALSRDEWKKIK
jgi:phosphate transport system substrate-binding protein